MTASCVAGPVDGSLRVEDARGSVCLLQLPHVDVRLSFSLSLSLSSQYYRLGRSSEGLLEVQVQDVHFFSLNNSFPYVNILRKWNKFCISFDFEKNEAQTAFNGRVSTLVRDPRTSPNMKGKSAGLV